MSKLDKDEFRANLDNAMLFHSMEDITLVLADTLGSILHESDPKVRAKLIKETCARITKRASGK